MATLSVIIITKDNELDIRRCLESVKWADEIIVLDSGSTDQTLTICEEYTKDVYSTDWPGFGPQKNRALDKATHDWVLSIDADEELSTELIAEIKTILDTNPKGLEAYRIHRVLNYFGKTIRHGEWKRDYPLRLCKRNIARFKNIIVHESIQLLEHKKIGNLKQVMWHYPYQDLTKLIYKINLYSSYGAQLRFESGEKSNMSIALIRSTWRFIRGYIFWLGFLDGREGFILAFAHSAGVFFCFSKLHDLRKIDKL